MAFGAVGSRRSVAMLTAVPASATADSSRPASRAVRTTFAPSAARWIAMARPIPRLAPVTITVFLIGFRLLQWPDYAGVRTDMKEIQIGATRVENHVVADEDVITFLGPGGSRVLSTPRMILFMERTCRNLFAEMLPEGFATVGMHVNIWHLAAAKEGATVAYKVELLK